MIEFMDRIPGLAGLARRLKPEPSPLPEPKGWTNRDVNDLLHDSELTLIQVGQDQQPIGQYGLGEINYDRLSAFPERTLLTATFTDPEGHDRTIDVVKVGNKWRKDFITDIYCDDQETRDLVGERSNRWERLRELDWPVPIWHGTDQTAMISIRDTRQHLLILAHSFCDVPGYGGEGHSSYLAYAMRASDILGMTPSGVQKLAPDLEKKLPYVDTINHKGKPTQFIDLNSQLEYPYSQALEDYLRAVHLLYAIGGEDTGASATIRVPCFQRTYPYDQKQERAVEYMPGGKPAGKINELISWRKDIYGPTVYELKDGRTITVFRPPIPVPLPPGNPAI